MVKNWKKYFFFKILKKMLILLTEFGFYRFSAFFWGIYFYNYSNFQKFVVNKMSFLIFMSPGFIAVKIYNVGDCFWFHMKNKDQNMYFKTSFEQLMAFLYVLQPISPLWAIKAHTCVITSFQSLCGIRLIIVHWFGYPISQKNSSIC